MITSKIVKLVGFSISYTRPYDSKQKPVTVENNPEGEVNIVRIFVSITTNRVFSTKNYLILNETLLFRGMISLGMKASLLNKSLHSITFANSVLFGSTHR